MTKISSIFEFEIELIFGISSKTHKEVYILYSSNKNGEEYCSDITLN